MSSNHLVASQS